jgi:hypothetical protein
MQRSSIWYEGGSSETTYEHPSETSPGVGGAPPRKEGSYEGARKDDPKYDDIWSFGPGCTPSKERHTKPEPRSEGPVSKSSCFLGDSPQTPFSRSARHAVIGTAPQLP